MWYIGNDESPSLSHHGILGMKWGIRRYQNYDGSLKNAGRKRYGVDKKQKTTSDEQSTKEKFWTDERKKTAKKIAVGVGVTAAVVGAGVVLYKSGALNKIYQKTIDNGGKIADDILKEHGSEKLNSDLQFFAEKTRAPITESEKIFADKGFTFSENPAKTFSEIGNVNPDNGNTNCKQVAYCAAMKCINGTNCVANGNKAWSGNLNKMMEDNFKNGAGKVISITAANTPHDSMERVKRQISKRYPEGAVGIISLPAKSSGVYSGDVIGAHAFNFKVERGEVSFFCKQKNLEDASVYFSSKMDLSREIEVIDTLGELIPNDSLFDGIRSSSR